MTAEVPLPPSRVEPVRCPDCGSEEFRYYEYVSTRRWVLGVRDGRLCIDAESEPIFECAIDDVNDLHGPIIECQNCQTGVSQLLRVLPIEWV